MLVRGLAPLLISHSMRFGWSGGCSRKRVWHHLSVICETVLLPCCLFCPLKTVGNSIIIDSGAGGLFVDTGVAKLRIALLGGSTGDGCGVTGFG